MGEDLTTILRLLGLAEIYVSAYILSGYAPEGVPGARALRHEIQELLYHMTPLDPIEEACHSGKEEVSHG